MTNIEPAEGDDMVYRATSGITEKVLGLRLSRSASLSGYCVAEGKPIRCDDTEQDSRVDQNACRAVGIRSMIVAPLKHETNVVGVLKVLAQEPNAFDDHDFEILLLISDLVASAMFFSAKYSSDELFYRATHDALTGLANRALFFDRLRSAMAQASRRSEGMAVVNLDMDGLKPINDRFGHRAGDMALSEVARKLGASARSGDTVARLGGDEFGAVLPKAETIAQAEAFSVRVRSQLERPLLVGDSPVPVGISIGIAIYPVDGRSAEDLFHCADERMYANKRHRKAGPSSPTTH